MESLTSSTMSAALQHRLRSEMTSKETARGADICGLLELVNRLRFGLFENRFKARVGPQRIPLPAQTELG
jgi:hypothetical protein